MVEMHPGGGRRFRDLVWKQDRWPPPMFIQPVYLACAIYQIMGFRQCHDPPSYCTAVLFFIRFVSIGELALLRVAVLQGR